MSRLFASPHRWTWLALLGLIAGGQIMCAQLTPASLSTLDVGFFECNVQPILDRDCSFPACHGDSGRPLFVYSTSKTRLGGDAQRGLPLSDAELCANFYRASAFARSDQGTSELVSKPASLDEDASLYHKGNYWFGPDDVEGQCLQSWMSGSSHPAGQAQGPPPECLLPWRVEASGEGPLCTPRSVDCADVVAGGGDG